MSVQFYCIVPTTSARDLSHVQFDCTRSVNALVEAVDKLLEELRASPVHPHLSAYLYAPPEAWEAVKGALASVKALQ